MQQRHDEQEIVDKAVEALRQRLGEDAVRYLAKRWGAKDFSIMYGIDVRELTRLTKLRARNAEQFAIALTDESARHAPHWFADARAPLPDDLRVVMLEYQYLKEPVEDGDDGFETLFNALGLCSRHEPGEITRFGKVDRARLRVDAVMTASDWERISISACNGAFGEMLKVIQRQPAGEQQFIVAGLIPRGVVTLLLARKAVGKTNALLELAVGIAERQATWWDFELHPSDGFVVLLLGEGSIEDAEERVRAMNGGQMPLLLKLQKFNEGTMIEDIIANLKRIKVDLLIIDPARKYYRGDEDSSDAVSTFFTNVEAFANQTKAGLVVSHHLKREAKPRSIHEVPHLLRGSQVWLDRPRVVLAMHRHGSETTFGIPVPDGDDPLHNMKAASMFSGVRRLRRDEATFTHIPTDADKKKGKRTEEQMEDDRVLAVIARLLEEDKRVSSSFKHELFSFKPRKRTWELDDMTRVEVRAAVQRLIEAGRVLKRASGALYLPQK
jgi:AAA domain